MARNPDKPHFSKTTLDMSERAQHTLGSAGASLVNMVAGSSSPAYIQLQWSKQKHLDPKDFEWCEVPGDPDVSRLSVPRFWKKAAVFGISLDSYYQAQEAYGPDENMEEAAVYEADGVVRIGTNPRSGFVAEVNGVDHVWTKTVAMRLGRGPLRATVGIWYPDHQKLVVPEDVRVIDAAAPIASLQDTYFGTNLI